MARADLDQLSALRQLLVSRGLPADADDEALLTAAGSARHKLHITVLSARESAGQPLTTAQQAELAAYRDRQKVYRAAWSTVQDAAPHAQVVKGWTIGDHYPAGTLRSAGDLDVVCPLAELWRAARALQDEGWEVEAFTLFPAQPGSDLDVSGWCHVLMELMRPADSGYIDEAYGVELRTADVATSIRVPAWRPDGGPLPETTANVLALAAERWERPFRTRDIYDLAILAGLMDQAALEALSRALAQTMLWPAYRELSRLLSDSGLGQPPALPGSSRAAWRARAARLRQATVLWAHPLRAIGLFATSTVDADRGALPDRLAQGVQRRIGSWRLLRLGLPLFAVPLAEPAAEPASGLTLEHRGRLLLARTPVGSFLLVAGSCPEEWLEEASARR
jgi:hypothetical protein